MIGIVGLDSRIPLALAGGGPPDSADLPQLTSFYRKLNEDLTPELRAKAIAEIAELSLWTDDIARQWIENDFDWLVVQRQPPIRAPWLIWAPDAPLIKTALEKCFERDRLPRSRRSIRRFRSNCTSGFAAARPALASKCADGADGNQRTRQA